MDQKGVARLQAGEEYDSMCIQMLFLISSCPLRAWEAISALTPGFAIVAPSATRQSAPRLRNANENCTTDVYGYIQNI